jgi:hypothetical protein
VGDPYRDSLTGLQARLRDLRREVAAREARTTQSFWRFLPAERAAHLRALKDATSVEGEDFDALARTERALQGYLAVLDQTFELVPELEQACYALPAKAPELELPRRSLLQRALGIDVQQAWERASKDLEAVLGTMHAGASRQQVPGLSALFTFHAEAAPFTLAFYFWSRDGATPENRHVLATSVAAVTPRLQLAPELARHWLLKPLKLVRDLQIDDAVFDGMFIIDADDQDGARALLGEEVRSALLRLAELDIPTLEVKDGRAELRWSYEPCASALRSATRVLAAIRRAPIKVQLLKD